MPLADIRRTTAASAHGSKCWLMGTEASFTATNLPQLGFRKVLSRTRTVPIPIDRYLRAIDLAEAALTEDMSRYLHLWAYPIQRVRGSLRQVRPRRATPSNRWFEREMPNAATRPLFEEAAKLDIGF